MKVEKKEEVKKYEIASISKLEFMIYLSSWMTVLILGCISIYKLAYRKLTIKYFYEYEMITKTYFGFYQSENEYFWNSVKYHVSNGWKSLTIYILVSKFLRAKTSPTVFMAGCITMSLYMNYYYSSIKFLALESSILIILSIAGLFRLKSLVWIIGLILIYEMKDIGRLDLFNEEYLFKNSYSYFALLITRAISVGLAISEAPKYNMKLLLDASFYYWYFPAIIGSRFMLMKNFIAEIYTPYVIQDWKKWFLSAIRVICWYLIWNIVTALVPFNLIILTHDVKTLDYFALSGGQMYYGIHVFIVYLLEYNASYLLTQLDGFLTAEGPECICHISLYNRLWKVFDVAMHLWIKENIFKPIAKLGDFRKTKFLAVFASFGFVVIFHGLRTETLLWISLNIAQFFLYSYLIYGFNNSSWGLTMQRVFSPGWNRRFIAMAGAISWLSSIYGFGCFSYGLEKNHIMYMSFLKKDGNKYYYRAFITLFVCYCQSQMALTANEYLLKRKEKKQ